MTTPAYTFGSNCTKQLRAQVAVNNPARPAQAPKTFTFDAVYDENTQQKNFYEESCYDLVEGVMEGYNGTIFAYGQVNPLEILQDKLERRLMCACTTPSKI